MGAAEGARGARSRGLSPAHPRSEQVQCFSGVRQSLEGDPDNLDKLYAAGYEEPEDLEDIEEEEASELGLTLAEVKILASRAEEHEARELMTTMLVTYRDSDGTNPFKDEEVWRPMVEALVAAGCETLQDVGHLSSGEVTGLSDENLAKLQGDPRVLAHTRKQEL